VRGDPGLLRLPAERVHREERVVRLPGLGQLARREGRAGEALDGQLVTELAVRKPELFERGGVASVRKLYLALQPVNLARLVQALAPGDLRRGLPRPLGSPNRPRRA